MRCVKIVIADPHPVVVLGLMSILSGKNDFNILASFYDGRECIQAIRDLSPDIALLNIFMPGLTGLDILAAATSEHLSTRIVFTYGYASGKPMATAAAPASRSPSPRVTLRCAYQCPIVGANVVLSTPIPRTYRAP